MKRRILVLPLAAALAGACAPPRPVPPAPVDAPVPPVLPPEGVPPPDPPPPPAGVLEPLGAEARAGRGYAALGLSGLNKPEGMEYRLRRDVPDDTPAHVPRTLDGLALWIAEPTPEGWLAFYRGPLAGLPESRNVPFRALLLRPDGSRAWEVDLGAHLGRPDHLEIQDVRYADGRLYFNEACQSYAREAEGRCSALLRLDPVRGVVEWRTPPLRSSDIILVHGPYVVAGYGFTAEADSLFLLERDSGRVLSRAGLDSAHDYLEMRGDTLVVVTTARVHRFLVR